MTEARSRNMRAIRGKDTKPELYVRSVLHRSGFRFRLHVRGLPGTPDLYLARYRLCLFVNSCFWHGHACDRSDGQKQKLISGVKKLRIRSRGTADSMMN